MNARAIWCLVLCCFLAQSAHALGNDQPIDPCKPAEAEDQPKPHGEEHRSLQDEPLSML